jgi:hypothetical protein
MAPPINPFKLMGKLADASSSTKAKGKGKGKGKEIGVKRKLKKPIEEAPVPEAMIQPTSEQDPILSPPKVHVLEDSDREEELQPRKKRGRTEPSSIRAEGPSSHSEAWDPALLFGPNPISIRDFVLNNSNTDVSAQVAHGLAFAACLPEDMKQWAGSQPGPAFRQITRGLMMVIALFPYLTFLYTVNGFSFFNFLSLSFLFTRVFLFRPLRVSCLWKQGSTD